MGAFTSLGTLESWQKTQAFAHSIICLDIHFQTNLASTSFRRVQEIVDVLKNITFQVVGIKKYAWTL